MNVTVMRWWRTMWVCTKWLTTCGGCLLVTILRWFECWTELVCVTWRFDCSTLCMQFWQRWQCGAMQVAGRWVRLWSISQDRCKLENKWALAPAWLMRSLSWQNHILQNCSGLPTVICCHVLPMNRMVRLLFTKRSRMLLGTSLGDDDG